MPVSPRKYPTMPLPPASGHGDLNNLRLQQARVLAVLVPTNPTDPPFEWPLLTRANLCLRAGFKLTSGSITRVLNGIRPGNRTSGEDVGLGCVCGGHWTRSFSTWEQA